jgi:hypothetical protein
MGGQTDYRHMRFSTKVPNILYHRKILIDAKENLDKKCDIKTCNMNTKKLNTPSIKQMHLNM